MKTVHQQIIIYSTIFYYLTQQVIQSKIHPQLSLTIHSHLPITPKLNLFSFKTQKHTTYQFQFSKTMAKYKKQSNIMAVILIILQIIVLFMYGFFVRVADPEIGQVQNNYPWLQDVNVMILIGFGYLMTFVNHYGWSALGYTFLITAVSIQYYTLWEGFWVMVFENKGAGKHIQMGMHTIIQGLFSAGSCLISMGALLGRVHPLDLIVMVLCQMAPYALVQILIFEVLHLQDVGGSMNIHMFGAFFGLAVSTIIGRKHSYGDNLPHITPMSAMFSFIGTIFLWMFWPSFNSALIDVAIYPYEKQLAIINTFLSLTGSVIATFITTTLFRSKFGIDEILNSTLAGGVIVGSSCNLITNPLGALAIGLFGGGFSSIGYIKISPLLTKIGVYDTCGIFNLHGMPGFFGGIFSAIFLAAYNLGTFNIAGDVSWNTGDFLIKGGRQMAGVGISLGIAIGSGILTGLLLLLIYRMEESDFFSDQFMWQIQDQNEFPLNNVHPQPVLLPGISTQFNQPIKISTFESNVQLQDGKD